MEEFSDCLKTLAVERELEWDESLKAMWTRD